MTKAFAALTATLTLYAAVAGLLLASPFDATAYASDTSGVAAERIGSAFANLAEFGVIPASDPAQPSDCGAATWPHIDPSCLLTSDGSTAEAVRVIY